MVESEGQDAWQKGYMEEARRIVKQNREEYEQMIRASNIISTKLCEVGSHKTDSPIFFCSQCKLSFCEKHGKKEKRLCENCSELEVGFD